MHLVIITRGCQHNNYNLQLNHKTAAQSDMLNLKIIMQHRNEMTINVIEQIIKVGFGTSNRKTWDISQLQKEA